MIEGIDKTAVAMMAFLGNDFFQVHSESINLSPFSFFTGQLQKIPNNCAAGNSKNISVQRQRYKEPVWQKSMNLLSTRRNLYGRVSFF